MRLLTQYIPIWSETTLWPSKISTHLTVDGKAAAWLAEDSPVIDACNFDSREYGTSQMFPGGRYALVMHPRNVEAFQFFGIQSTGYSFIFSDIDLYHSTVANAPKFHYPVKTKHPGVYRVWFRMQGGSASTAVLLDGKVVATMSHGFMANMTWNYADIVLPDKKEHLLGYAHQDGSLYVDKIYISATNAATPTGAGPNYTDAAYLTIHGVAGAMSEDTITYTAPYFGYGFMSSRDMKKTGWYNFDVTIFNVSGLTFPSIESANAANWEFGLGVCGARDDHSIGWSYAKEYTYKSGLYVSSTEYSFDTTQSRAIRVYSTVSSVTDCQITTPDAKLTTLALNDFSSESLHPVHDNTVRIDDNDGGDDVQLDVSEKIVSVIVDQSGSMSWNDSTGLRHTLSQAIGNTLEARYPCRRSFQPFAAQRRSVVLVHGSANYAGGNQPRRGHH
jgi:hypothetical protein